MQLAIYANYCRKISVSDRLSCFISYLSLVLIDSGSGQGSEGLRDPNSADPVGHGL